MMGGGSSSSTATTENRTETNQTDRRIGATDNAVVFAPEANSPIDLTLTDELAYQAVDEAGQLITDFSARAFDSIDQLSGSFAAIKAKEAQQQGEVAETVKDLAKYAALAGVAYGAIRLWGK